MGTTEANKNTLITVAKWVGFVMLPIGVLSWLVGEPIGNFVAENKVAYCTLFWVCLSLLWGSTEARYIMYRENSSKNDQYNPHTLWFTIRAIVLICLWIIIKDWKSVLCLPFMFGFFHDGMYYVERNNLDNTLYPKKWFDQSTTSTSWMDVKHLTGPVVRTICFLAGLTALIILNWK